MSLLLCRGRGMQRTLSLVVAVLLLVQPAEAQVDPAAFANSGGAPKGAWETTKKSPPPGPPVNCSGAWTAYGACSPTSRQWRFFEPTRWAENGGQACPQQLSEERACTYPGPRLLYASGGFADPWRPRCSRRDGACEFPLITAAVGDSIVFLSPDGAPRVSRLASTWHYSVCDFTESHTVDVGRVVSKEGVSATGFSHHVSFSVLRAEAPGLWPARAHKCRSGFRARPPVCLSPPPKHSLSQVLLSDMYQYTVREADRGRSLYLSSSDASRCGLGQAQILKSTPR